MNELILKQINKDYPTKLNDMKVYTPAISEYLKTYEGKEILAHELMRIISKYLEINIKSRAINSSGAIELIFEYIITECSNLELQEIDFIFRSGIMGKFGVIYNDISIDTICGKDGWIETYYKEFRKLRPEPTQQIKHDLTGKEITKEQFLNNNPKEKVYSELREILYKATTNLLRIEDVKLFYKLKELTLNDFKDDSEIYCAEYHKLSDDLKGCIGEMNYILQKHKEFILANIYKTKK